MTLRQHFGIWLHGQAIKLCPEIATAVDQIAEQRAQQMVNEHQQQVALAQHRKAVAARANRQ